MVLREKVREIEAFAQKEATLIAEIERLNNTLRLKVEESEHWDKSHRDLKEQLLIAQQTLTA